MITILEFQCEICRSRFRSPEAALACEARGITGGPDAAPVGCVFGDPSPGNFYSGITFAVAEWREPSGHYRSPLLWACRDNGAGDSLGREMCSGGGGISGRPDPKHPTFKRLVTWLKSQKIPVTCWDGEKAIPLADYLKQTKVTK